MEQRARAALSRGQRVLVASLILLIVGTTSARAVASPKTSRPAADLATTVQASATTARTGDAVVLTTSVSNDGAGVAEAVRLSYRFPSGLSVVAPAGCTRDTASVTCDAGSLDPGVTVQRAFEVRSASNSSGVHTIEASTGSRETDPSNNVASTTITFVAVWADLSVSLSHTSSPGAHSGAAVLIATVKNNGPNIAEGVRLQTDNKAACVPAGQCELGTMAAGDTRTIPVAVTWVRRQTYDQVRVEVRVGADTPDPDATNNTASWTTTVSPPPQPPCIPTHPAHYCPTIPL